MEEKLVAPDVDRLLSRFDRRSTNLSAQTRAVNDALDRLFEVLGELDPIAINDEAKSIWLRVPRGSLDDYADYNQLLEEGEVSSREEYIALRNSEYPEYYS